MALILGNSHSEVPLPTTTDEAQAQLNGSKQGIGRACANYHPSVWGDHFLVTSLDEKEDKNIKRRAEVLKKEVKKMFDNINEHPFDGADLVDAIQRLGVAYHFENEIDKALQHMFAAYVHVTHPDNGGVNLHAVALRFRLLRQQGYNVSSDVFKKFKDSEGKFQETLSTEIRGLLSLYEAAYLGTHGDDILDEAITFTTKHLKSALPHLNSPLSALVKLALELPLHKIVERIQARYYISIYEEENERIDLLLEFAKIEFSMLQLLHKRELREISRWWKENDFATKLPFIRDRIVECYFWIVGVFFEPHYSRARLMMTKIISLTSVMDDIYDVYGTLEELELYTAILERWDRAAIDQLPEYMKVHFVPLLDAVDDFERELSQEEKSYRISYLKEAYKGLAKAYLQEAKWANSGYVPNYEEYMKIALISSAYPMLTVISLVGMGDIVTKEVFEWAIYVPKLVIASSVICRLKDDITSSELEQERGHVASAIECYMKEHGTSHSETCQKFREMIAFAWKEVNWEFLQQTSIPTQVMKRTLNLTRVIEVLYSNQDSYTNSGRETKERIRSVLVEPIPM